LEEVQERIENAVSTLRPCPPVSPPLASFFKGVVGGIIQSEQGPDIEQEPEIITAAVAWWWGKDCTQVGVSLDQTFYLSSPKADGTRCLFLQAGLKFGFHDNTSSSPSMSTLQPLSFRRFSTSCLTALLLLNTTGSTLMGNSTLFCSSSLIALT